MPHSINRGTERGHPISNATYHAESQHVEKTIAAAVATVAKSVSDDQPVKKAKRKTKAKAKK